MTSSMLRRILTTGTRRCGFFCREGCGTIKGRWMTGLWKLSSISVSPWLLVVFSILMCDMPTFPYNFPCGCSLRCIFEQPEKGQPRTNHVAVLWRKLYAFQDLFLRIWVTEKPCEISQQSKLFNRYIVFLQSQNEGFVIEWQVPLGLFLGDKAKVKGQRSFNTSVWRRDELSWFYWVIWDHLGTVQDSYHPTHGLEGWTKTSHES